MSSGRLSREGQVFRAQPDQTNTRPVGRKSRYRPSFHPPHRFRALPEPFGWTCDVREKWVSRRLGCGSRSPTICTECTLSTGRSRLGVGSPLITDHRCHQYAVVAVSPTNPTSHYQILPGCRSALASAAPSARGPVSALASSPSPHPERVVRLRQSPSAFLIPSSHQTT